MSFSTDCSYRWWCDCARECDCCYACGEKMSYIRATCQVSSVTALSSLRPILSERRQIDSPQASPIWFHPACTTTKDMFISPCIKGRSSLCIAALWKYCVNNATPSDNSLQLQFIYKVVTVTSWPINSNLIVSCQYKSTRSQCFATSRERRFESLFKIYVVF